MKGLLIKDFALFMKQKNILLMIALMFFMLTMIGVLNSTFIMGYVPFVFCMYVISSITYDEFDNGMPFLMTLPVSKKVYVIEKYMFGLCMAVLGNLLAVILVSIEQIKKLGITGFQAWIPEEIFTVITIFLLMEIFIGTIVPIYLKFGNEKARIVLFAIGIGVMGTGYLFAKYRKALPVPVTAFIQLCIPTEKWKLIFATLIVTVIFLILSYRISVHIIEKKEF